MSSEVEDVEAEVIDTPEVISGADRCLRDRDADGESYPERADPEDDACDAWMRRE